MFQKMFSFAIENSGYAIIVGVIGVEFVLRKFPGARPLFQTISNIFDNIPGFKNNPGK